MLLLAPEKNYSSIDEIRDAFHNNESFQLCASYCQHPVGKKICKDDVRGAKEAFIIFNGSHVIVKV